MSSFVFENGWRGGGTIVHTIVSNYFEVLLRSRHKSTYLKLLDSFLGDVYRGRKGVNYLAVYSSILSVLL